jgi:hypothetical protein
MNYRQRQVVAEKVSSTVRVLELLGLEYSVAAPRRARKKGNKSPRVVSVDVGKRLRLRVYNSTSGSTWAHEPGGQPIPGHIIERFQRGGHLEIGELGAQAIARGFTRRRRASPQRRHERTRDSSTAQPEWQ